jgi:isopenicillin-N epimerase
MNTLRAHWALDPDVVFLNHGSFGACPRTVLDRQSALRAQLEREPVRFFMRELEPLLDSAREEVARFVGARTEDVVFVRNATSGVNAVLRSLDLSPDDELLTTDHVYGACLQAMRHVAERAGARVVLARVPFPLASADEVTQAVLGAVTPRTKLALIDHVTSPTGLVFPVADIVRALASRGVDTLVDGAHAPGMVTLDLEALGAAYYTANFHKWTCAPKGAAMLWARRDRQASLHPTVISHGYASPRPRKRLLEEFDWTGTDDPTAWLCVPDALRFVGGLVEGGWPAVQAHNRALALRARALLCEALSVPPPAPESMIGSLAAVPLPPGPAVARTSEVEPLQDALFARHRVEVPLPPWPAPPARLLRISAHLHNSLDEYQLLCEALGEELRIEGARDGSSLAGR